MNIYNNKRLWLLGEDNFGDFWYEIGLPRDNDKRGNPCSDFKCKGYLTFKKNDKFYKCNKCNITEEI